MLIYEVNLSVDKEIEEQYKEWLGAHVQEMLQNEGFLGAEWLSRNAVDEGLPADDTKVLWTVHYRVTDDAALQHYFEHHAPRMRQDGLNRFGGRFTASRRILRLSSSFSPASA